jgi:hypothetical protein
MCRQAIEYARRSWDVFPLRPGYKAPLTPHGHLDATTDLARVADWWTANPAAGIGLALKASGLVAIDCDPRNGGTDSYDALVDEHGRLPDTLTSITGGGGWHRIYRRPDGVELDPHPAPGIDVKTDGYIILPPSLHPSGQPYQWEASSSPGDVDVAELSPGWTGALARNGSTSALALYDQGEAIASGARDNTLYRLACRLRAQGLSEAAILGAISAENTERCRPPLPERDLGRIASSAATKPLGVPAGEVRRASAQANAAPLGTRVADVDREEVTWLWPGRIPFGKLTVLDGDPGLGKSMASLDIAARVTRGDPMPDGTVPDSMPGVGCPVLLIGAEDGIGDTIRPRLEAAGADLTLAVSLSLVPCPDGSQRLFTVPDDVELLRRCIKDQGATLVIIDPLMAHLAEKTNSWRDQDVRRALTPLAKVAEETGVAIILIRHLNKGSGGSAVYRGGGSIGIVAQARSGLLVAKDPEDEAYRVLAATKHNLAPAPASLRYRIADGDLGPRVDWCGTSAHTADGLVAEANAPADWAQREAADFLSKLLADGSVQQRECERQAAEEGITSRTLRRARERLHIKARKLGGTMGGPWVWELPANEPTGT